VQFDAEIGLWDQFGQHAAENFCGATYLLTYVPIDIDPLRKCRIKHASAAYPAVPMRSWLRTFSRSSQLPVRQLKLLMGLRKQLSYFQMPTRQSKVESRQSFYT